MDWEDAPDQARFRREVQGFLSTSLPARYRKLAESDAVHEEQPWQADRLSEKTEERAVADEWRRALVERRWVAPAWPEEYGGAGLGVTEQFILNEEMARSGAPLVNSTAVNMLGPSVIVHGTDEQKRQQLPLILSGERVWAQGFSEPGAGSDLASLSTRAVRDGDEFVVNGQKIWTTLAHQSDWIFALVRTDPDAPKHRGISFVLVDKRMPGVTVQPLINAAWMHNFNEVFFEDVRIPATNLVGEENRGWYVAMTLLAFERSAVARAVRLERGVQRLVDYARSERGSRQARLSQLDSVRALLADRYIETQVLYNFSLRIISIQAAGGVPDYEASISKVFGSELAQRITHSAAKLFGLYGELWDQEAPWAPMEGSVAQNYVLSIPNTLTGGSSEIQRNVIATRGLGLPRG